MKFILGICVALGAILTFTSAQKGVGIKICTKKKADLTFILDSSGSIRLSNPVGGPDNWKLILEFVEKVIQQLEIGLDEVRVAVVSYSNNTVINFDLDEYSDKTALINAVLSIKYIPEEQGISDLHDAWTNTAGAINTMRGQIFNPQNNKGDRPNIQNIALVVTDGISNINHQLTVPYADKAHDEGITMYAVGVTSQVKEEEVEGISSTGKKGETYWLSPSFAAVSNIVDTIVAETCKQISTEWGPWQLWGPCSRQCGGGVQRRSRVCISDIEDSCVGVTDQTRMCNTQPCCGTVCTDSPVDLTFLLDSSGSIRENNPPNADNWALMLDFIAQICRRLDISPNQIRVAAVSFSDRADVNWKLDTYLDKGQLMDAIRKIKYMGYVTNTPEGLEIMRTQVFDPFKLNQNGDRSDVDNVAIVITDGYANVNEHNTIPFADRCDSEGIQMLAVGITNEVKEDELKGISSTGVLGETYWMSPSYTVTDDIIEQIVQRTCDSSKGWTPWTAWSDCTKTCEGGVQSRTRVCKRQNCPGDDKETRTCNTQSCSGVVCTGEKADIVFVLDSSNSIQKQNWDIMLQFVVNLVDRLNVGPDDIRVGMVTYSNYTNVDFTLDHYYDKTQMVNAIRGIPYMNAWTNTAAGIKTMHENVFDTTGFNLRGDRTNAKNIAICITDGASNINDDMTIPYADAAYNDGIEMLAVGITDRVVERELEGISGTGVHGQSYWMAATFDVSTEIIESIIRHTCQKISGWTQWGMWSDCTATCGGGERRRTRICGGGSCPGSRVDTEFCALFACDNVLGPIGRGPAIPGVRPTVANLCKGKYKDGQKWTMRKDSMPYDCTCSISGVLASERCTPKGCRYEGLVYLVDETWTAPLNATAYKQCSCKADAQTNLPTRQCATVQSSVISTGEILCEGQYKDRQEYTKVQNGITNRCTCTVFTNSWSSKCVPTACDYKGAIHQVGTEWEGTVEGEKANCRCHAIRNGVRWHCQTVPKPPKCENKYKEGEKWTKTMNGLPHECTCSINATARAWFSNCVPTACDYKGAIHAVGTEWEGTVNGEEATCNCFSTNKGPSWSCKTVPKCQYGQRRYRHNEKWTMKTGDMPYECTCTVTGDTARYNCSPRGCKDSASGRVYLPGQSWTSGGRTCRCYRSGDSTRYSCL